MDGACRGEWEGVILFRDDNGNHRQILVETEDHDRFDGWLTDNPDADDNVTQNFARIMLMDMCNRKFKPMDYLDEMPNPQA